MVVTMFEVPWGWEYSGWRRRGNGGEEAVVFGGGGGQEVDRADWEWGGMGWEATPSCLSCISAPVLVFLSI